MKKILILTMFLLTSCSGIRESGNHFTVHAENFNILGLSIPAKSDQARALSLVPHGSTIVSQRSSPLDWNSVLGVINKIIGFSYTEISGTTEGKPNV